LADLRLCSVCNIEKPLTDYFKRKRNKDGYFKQCKECAQKGHKLKYKTDEVYRKRRIQNTIASKRKQWYNISRDEFKELFESQNGCCSICSIELDGSRKGLLGHLDHCHITKKVRGILCGGCNMALGLFKDNEEFLLSAAQYLKDNR